VAGGFGRRGHCCTRPGSYDPRDAEERQAPRAEGLDPDDPAAIAAIDLLRFEGLVTHLAAAGRTIYVLVEGRWGDRHTQLAQLCADRLDTPPQTISTVTATLMISNEPGDQCCGRSSSAAKKADAVFKIALALRNSETSRLSFFS
jgi:hypothetical protein